MSMTRFTVKELKEFIKDLPDETLVVSIHPGMDDWGNEGMWDGVHPFLTSDINEIRSGIIPSDDDVWYNDPVLMLGSLDKETMLEWWEDYIEDTK